MHATRTTTLNDPLSARSHAPHTPQAARTRALDHVARDASPATRLATPAHRRRALILSLLIAVVTALLIPVATDKWARVPAFLPTYQTALVLAYAITAYLIYGHFRATRARALLYLAGGSVYTAVIVLVQFLSIPAMFTASGTLIGGPQTTIWLWCLWHVGPVVGILLYVLSLRRDPALLVSDLHGTTRRFFAGLAAITAASVLVVTVFHDALPVLDIGGDFRFITTKGIAPALQVVIGLTLVLLWRISRFRTVLNLWLGVALVALLFDNAITMVGGERLTVGWYVGRFNALISGFTMLLVYVHEITRVYQNAAAEAQRLAHSNALLEGRIDEARLDTLTGLAGRGLFFELAQREQHRARLGHYASALLFIDLDGFKKVNDERGHLTGDAVLAQVAQSLRGVIRSSDVVGRIGGDEFVIALTAPRAQIDITAQRIAAHAVAAVARLGHGLSCSVGVGVSTAEQPDLERLLHHADLAMYEAKKRGKNGYWVFGAP